MMSIWIIATIIYVVLCIRTFYKMDGLWDFTPIFVIPLLTLGYAVYWIIQLIIWNN